MHSKRTRRRAARVVRALRPGGLFAPAAGPAALGTEVLEGRHTIEPRIRAEPRRSRVTRGVTTIDRARDRPFAGGRDRRLFLCRRRLVAGIMQRGYCRDSVIARGRTDCRSPRAYAPGHIVRFACHGYAELMNGNGPIKYCGSVSIEPASGYTTIGALDVVELRRREGTRCHRARRGRIPGNWASCTPSPERKPRSTRMPPCADDRAAIPGQRLAACPRPDHRLDHRLDDEENEAGPGHHRCACPARREDARSGVVADIAALGSEPPDPVARTAAGFIHSLARAANLGSQALKDDPRPLVQCHARAPTVHRGEAYHGANTLQDRLGLSPTAASRAPRIPRDGRARRLR